MVRLRIQLKKETSGASRVLSIKTSSGTGDQLLLRYPTAQNSNFTFRVLKVLIFIQAKQAFFYFQSNYSLVNIEVVHHVSLVLLNTSPAIN